MPKNTLVKLGIGLIVVMFAGCASTKNAAKPAQPAEGKSGLTTRAYIADKDRVDQDMQGNFGYMQGTPVAPDRSNLKKTRKVYVLEVTKEPPEGVTQTTVPASGASLIAPDLQVEPQAPAPAKQRVVIPRIEDESTGKSATVAKTAAAGGQAYTVGKGDTLQKISKKFYGSFSKWNKIYQANKDAIKDPNRLRVGTELKIPALN